MRNPGQSIKLDIVTGRVALEDPLGLFAQLSHRVELPVKARDRLTRHVEQITHQTVTFGIFLGGATALDFGQAVMQRLDQQMATLGVVQQIILQIRVALNHPDVTQNLVEHAGRTAGAALATQFLQQIPGRIAQQAQDDLTVGKRGVVVGDLSQAGTLLGGGHQLIQCRGCIHGGDNINLGGLGAGQPSPQCGQYKDQHTVSRKAAVGPAQDPQSESLRQATDRQQGQTGHQKAPLGR